MVPVVGLLLLPPGSHFRAPWISAAGFGHGLWLLRVHHHAGSLEAIVVQARRRNLALSAGSSAPDPCNHRSLVRFSRRAQVVAELQMNFVAGVSHDCEPAHGDSHRRI